jgi:hypothetical protein
MTILSIRAAPLILLLQQHEASDAAELPLLAYMPAKDIARALVLQLRCRLHALPVVPLIARQVSQRAC